MNNPQVEKSKCFTCKYGICIKQIDEGEIVPIAPKPKEDWVSSEEDGADHDHGLLKGNGVFALCFWPTKVMKHDLPIQIGFVENCNRYEKISDTKRDLTKPNSDV